MAALWRAPYGEKNRNILRWAAEAGFRHAVWSYHCDTRGWVADTLSEWYRSNREITRYILNIEQRQGLSGKIILMHLGTERKNDFPYQTLPQMINELKKRSYRFVAGSQLIRMSYL